MDNNVIHWQDVLAQRLKREHAEARQTLDRVTRAEEDIPAAVIMEAARREDTVFLSGQDSRHKGMKMLKGHPRHRLLSAVFNDSIEDFYRIRYGQTTGALNQRSFWSFPDRPGQAYFLTPAHVCRAFNMAVNLHQSGADFRIPDSEGRLPLYFLSRYAADASVIPYVAFKYQINANDSGHWQNAEFPDLARPYDPPMFRAIKYGNLNAVQGLKILPRNQIDMNLPFTEAELTPLIYAVMTAEEQVEKGTGLYARLAIVLAIVRDLAAAPFVNPDKRDATGWTAADYAKSADVCKALKKGLGRRDPSLSW